MYDDICRRYEETRWRITFVETDLSHNVKHAKFYSLKSHVSYGKA